MAAHDPIKVGSAGLADLVPQPGARIVTNDFGIDTCELSYFLNSYDTALSLRPARGDAYAGGSNLPLTGFYVDDAEVTLNEGKCAELHVVYKKINSGRTALILPGSDVEYKSVNVLIEAVSFDFSDIPVPAPTVTKRYASTTRPPATGSFENSPSGFPSTPDYYYPLYNVTTLTQLNAVYRRNPRGWVNIRINSTPLCENRFYEIEELWKITYLFYRSEVL